MNFKVDIADKSEAELCERLNYFSSIEVYNYLSDPMAENRYPIELVSKLKDIGIFGIGVSNEYGGKNLSGRGKSKVFNLLSQGWLSLSAMLGSHVKACSYIEELGTSDQKHRWLGKMANGEIILAHAFNERQHKSPGNFETVLTKDGDSYILNGKKDWVTNARHADRILVVARTEFETYDSHAGLIAALVDPSSEEVHIGKELERPGNKGVSLAPVSFHNYPIQREDIYGLDQDMLSLLERNKASSIISFASRAVGAGIAAFELVKDYLQSQATVHEVVAYKFGECYKDLVSAQAMLQYALERNDSSKFGLDLAFSTKVFCTETLQKLMHLITPLIGGEGYANKDGRLQRIYRDAISLSIVGIPNNTLLNQIGHSLIKHS